MGMLRSTKQKFRNLKAKHKFALIGLLLLGGWFVFKGIPGLGAHVENRLAAENAREFKVAKSIAETLLRDKPNRSLRDMGPQLWAMRLDNKRDLGRDYLRAAPAFDGSGICLRATRDGNLKMMIPAFNKAGARTSSRDEPVARLGDTLEPAEGGACGN